MKIIREWGPILIFFLEMQTIFSKKIPTSLITLSVVERLQTFEKNWKSFPVFRTAIFYRILVHWTGRLMHQFFINLQKIKIQTYSPAKLPIRLIQHGLSPHFFIWKSLVINQVSVLDFSNWTVDRWNLAKTADLVAFFPRWTYFPLPSPKPFFFQRLQGYYPYGTNLRLVGTFRGRDCQKTCLRWGS